MNAHESLILSVRRLRALLAKERGVDEESQGAYDALERALRDEQPLGSTLAHLASRACLAGDLAHAAHQEVRS